jgi:hypothetical protein
METTLGATVDGNEGLPPPNTLAYVAPRGYEISLMLNPPPEMSFMHLFCLAFKEHFGAERYIVHSPWILKFSQYLQARVQTLQRDTVRIYFSLQPSSQYTCGCVFFLYALPTDISFGIFDF